MGISRSIGIGSERGFGHLLNRRFLGMKTYERDELEDTLGGENQGKRKEKKLKNLIYTSGVEHSAPPLSFIHNIFSY